MDYDGIFSNAIAGIKDEGRYRVFMDIERKNGDFPSAIWHTEACLLYTSDAADE